MIIRKAVFPVAGLGTRFLPATKAMPKEMLPVVDSNATILHRRCGQSSVLQPRSYALQQ
jgi:CTP:phosphocholine cytidylyltransferase-like protein